VRPAILVSEDRRLGVANSVNPNLVNPIIHQDGRWQGEFLPEKMYLGSGPISGRTTYNSRDEDLERLNHPDLSCLAQINRKSLELVEDLA